MIHSAPRATATAVAVIPAHSKKNELFFPKGARPAPRPPRPNFMTRRYEMSWLNADGQVESAQRAAPALPEFEEAFSAIARGTLIETTVGLIAVEDLEPGMQVVTAEGTARKITWIGSMTLFPPNAVAGLAPATLTRITAEAFGEGRPMPDLILGQRARLLTRGARARAAGFAAAFVPARDYIDGDAIIEVTPVAPVTMFHLVLEQHAALRCAGIEVESFHPGKNAGERFDAQLAALFLALFPQIRGFADFGPLAHARLAGESDTLAAA